MSDPAAPSPRPQRLTGRLAVDTEQGAFLGDTRIRLLEAIAEHGSITQAAKFVPLSYKAAWDAVDAMNNLAEQPLVTRASGGRHGGGTRLTDYGRRMIELYRALEAEYQSALTHLAQRLGDDGEARSFGEFRRLLHRMTMKSSARNQFFGTIVGLTADAVDCEVRLRLDDAHELTSVITRESAETLGLAIGMEIWALIKSSSVMLLVDPQVRTSARNCLWGEISRLHRSKVSAEATLALASGKSVCAVISNDSADRLGLQIGSPACAVFKASSVILCMPIAPAATETPP